MEFLHVSISVATTDLFLFSYPSISLVFLLEAKIELVSSQVFTLNLTNLFLYE